MRERISLFGLLNASTEMRIINIQEECGIASMQPSKILIVKKIGQCRESNFPKVFQNFHELSNIVLIKALPFMRFDPLTDLLLFLLAK